MVADVQLWRAAQQQRHRSGFRHHRTELPYQRGGAGGVAPPHWADPRGGVGGGAAKVSLLPRPHDG